MPVLWTQIFFCFHMDEQLFLSQLLSTSLASSCKQEVLFASVGDVAEIIMFGPDLHHPPVSSAQSWEVGQGAESAGRWSSLPPQHCAEKGEKAWAVSRALLFYEAVVDYLFICLFLIPWPLWVWEEVNRSIDLCFSSGAGKLFFEDSQETSNCSLLE